MYASNSSVDEGGDVDAIYPTWNEIGRVDGDICESLGYSVAINERATLVATGTGPYSGFVRIARIACDDVSIHDSIASTTTSITTISPMPTQTPTIYPVAFLPSSNESNSCVVGPTLTHILILVLTPCWVIISLW